MKYRFMIYIFIASFLILGQTVPVPSKVDEEFHPYLESYQALSKINPYDYNIVMSFEEMPITTAGYCQRVESVLTGKIIRRNIRIHPKIWKIFSETERNVLVWHEISHCIKNREHDTTLLKDNCPSSMMYPEVLSDHCSNKHWDHYIQELFGKDS